MPATWMLVARTLLSLVVVAAVGAAQLDEYGVKAGFVYNFLQFVDWPASKLPAAEPVTVCVIGESPITARLTPMIGQVVRGHALRARAVPSAWDVVACHVIYVPVTYDGRVSEISARRRGEGQLIISEVPGSLSDAVIGLDLRDGRVTFEINLDLAAQQGLTVSSKLLRLARRVTGEGRVSPWSAPRASPRDRPTREKDN